MELRLLEYFLAIDGAGSISRAAERLHITQLHSPANSSSWKTS